MGNGSVPRATKGRLGTYTVAGVISLVIFAAYLPALRNGFVNWDDDLYVYDNGNIRSLGGTFLKWAFSSFHAGNWHPLTWLSHAVDYAVWGLNPAGHHLTSVLLHAVNAFLVVVLAVKLLEAWRGETPGGRNPGILHDRQVLIAAAVTGLAFGLHPLRVESVAWASERKDLLCALFFLLSIVFYVRYAVQADRDGRRRGLASAWLSGPYLLTAACFCLALLSKPMAVTLPAVALIIDWFPLKRTGSAGALRRVVIEKVPLFTLSAASSIVTFLAQQEGGAVSADPPSVMTRIFVAAGALVAYLSKSVLPVGLLPYYPYPAGPAPALLSVQGGAAVAILGITGACSLAARKNPVWMAVWSWYVLTLVPVLGIAVQAGTQSMADRYTYLPGLGPLFLAGLGAASVWTWADSRERGRRAIKGAIAIAGACLFGLLVLRTADQIALWKDSVTLWSGVISREPARVPFAYNNRGLAYKELGRTDQALEDFNRAIALDPTFVNAYISRGWLFQEQGLTGRAMEDYATAIMLDPARSIAYNNRGMVYQGEGRPDLAILEFTEAVKQNPLFAEAFTNRGLAYEQTGQISRALDDYTSAIKVNPSFANAYNNRGLLFERTGRLDEALADLDSAIRLNPSGIEAYNNRGLVYEDLGEFERAVEDYSRAIKLRPDDHLAYSNRAIVFQKMGRNDKAGEDERTARSLKPHQGKASAD